MTEERATYHPEPKATRRLPGDTTRCHDGQCGARDQCERFIQRNDRGDWVARATTLKLGYYVHHLPCDHYIGPQWPENEEDVE